jgi:hypothetical protein
MRGRVTTADEYFTREITISSWVKYAAEGDQLDEFIREMG